MKKQNYKIKCKCGCGHLLLKFDSRNRPRQFLMGHNKSRLGMTNSAEHNRKVAESLHNNAEVCERMRKMCRNKLGRKFPYLQGEGSWRWQGDKVKYLPLHNWVRRKLQKPNKCQICSKITKLEWANKDHLYKRNLKDWLALCNKCHRVFDKDKKIGKYEYENRPNRQGS